VRNQGTGCKSKAYLSLTEETITKQNKRLPIEDNNVKDGESRAVKAAMSLNQIPLIVNIFPTLSLFCLKRDR